MGGTNLEMDRVLLHSSLWILLVSTPSSFLFLFTALLALIQFSLSIRCDSFIFSFSVSSHSFSSLPYPLMSSTIPVEDIQWEEDDPVKIKDHRGNSQGTGVIIFTTWSIYDNVHMTLSSRDNPLILVDHSEIAAPWNRRPSRHYHAPPSYGRYNRSDIFISQNLRNRLCSKNRSFRYHDHTPCWGYGCIVNVQYRRRLVCIPFIISQLPSISVHTRPNYLILSLIEYLLPNPFIPIQLFFVVVQYKVDSRIPWGQMCVKIIPCGPNNIILLAVC